MGCALSTAAGFKYAGSGFIPTSDRTARQERSLLLIPEGFVYIWALTRVSGVSEFTAVKLNKIHVCRLACQTNVELSWFHWISESMVFLFLTDLFGDSSLNFWWKKNGDSRNVHR